MKINRTHILNIVVVLVLLSLVGSACRSAQPTPVPTESIPFPPIDMPDPAPNGPVGTARVNVNVRTGPSMLFPILGTAQQGDKGEILGISPDGYWYAVKVPTSVVGTGTAWVAADYVDLSNPTGGPLTEITPPLLPPLVNFPVPPAGTPQVIMREAATLRSGPTLEFPVYGTAPPGSRAEVLGESEDKDWWVLRMPTSLSEDGTGWVPKLSLGKVGTGSVLAVVGVSPDGEFYVVNVPTEIDPGGRGWVPARYVRTENVRDVPVVQPPPVP
ncbi:MAG: SH3 domain-containing protein [Anaerolineales bacterium]